MAWNVPQKIVQMPEKKYFIDHSDFVTKPARPLESNASQVLQSDPSSSIEGLEVDVLSRAHESILKTDLKLDSINAALPLDVHSINSGVSLEPVGSKLAETQAINVKNKRFSFEKKQSVVSSEEQSQTNYKKAEYFFQKKDFAKAEYFLNQILDQQCDYHLARSLLAKVYLEQRKLEDAKNCLVEGLNLDEHQTDFLRLLAVVHDRLEESEKALSVLLKVKNDSRTDRKYMSFLAYLYQKTGRYDLAKQQYFRLLEQEPTNAHWMLGVSVAFDSEGQKPEAALWYQKLTLSENIDPLVKQYAENRLRILKG